MTTTELRGLLRDARIWLDAAERDMSRRRWSEAAASATMAEGLAHDLAAEAERYGAVRLASHRTTNRKAT